ncbi:BON domain-containing protein [Singulisphaera acidiphila]|uniref:Putative periplasmic or secreted lipoprotein n=1 Tax=Singulisphaera acidiphila (strain ATCC BAA-1392 / DSM 18658 / VKM B-2454 / MOB10) TaxID=886293 RepID=L0DJG1_SINAD|nr:BON domain-containing protein [Singulisphaera acidiphila]AGA28985.1 putative periplasmic or secreted lipoprotein [Singulisphaera acidiphila DSM 18658]
MSLKLWSLAVPFVSFALVASTCAAQEPATGEKPAPPVGERVGEKVDSAVQSLKKGVSNAGEAIRDQYEKARAGVHNMSVAARVYGRLHWDKALTNSKVEIEVHKDGVAVLTGSVGDAMARAKAVQLAQDTVGVTKVIDQLVVLTTSTGAIPARETSVKP